MTGLTPRPRPTFDAPVRSLPAALFTLGFAAALPGCFSTHGASKNAVPLVLVHAQKDLDCPQQDIRVTQDLGGRFTAIGCGHKRVYNTACDALQCVVNDEASPVPWHVRPDPVRTP